MSNNLINVPDAALKSLDLATERSVRASQVRVLTVYNAGGDFTDPTVLEAIQAERIAKHVLANVTASVQEEYSVRAAMAIVVVWEGKPAYAFQITAPDGALKETFVTGADQFTKAYAAALKRCNIEDTATLVDMMV